MDYFNLNYFAGNFASYIKNFSDKIFYGITSNGSMFTLLPEYHSMNTSSISSSAGIYVETKVISDQTRIDTLASKMYELPLPNYPLYIEEHNIVLFSSAEERAKTAEMYDNGQKLVKSYAAGMVNLINASYKAITCLNVDKQFYTLSNSGIVKIPTADKKYVLEVLRKNHLAVEILDTCLVFILNTVIKNTKTDGGQREAIVNTEIKIIEKRKVIKGEPIVTESEGIVIFDGRQNAEDFINAYGTVSNYMIKKAISVTKKMHQSEIEDLNEQVKKDKRGMVETFGLMGITSIVSILTENVIKSYNSGDDELIKKSLKILGIGAIGCGTVVGIYKGIQLVNEKFKQTNN